MGMVRTEYFHFREIERLKMYFSQCIDFIIEAVVELILNVYYIYENELNSEKLGLLTYPIF